MRGLLQRAPDLIALFVNRGDGEPGRHAQSDQGRFGKLQARFDRLGHGVGRTEHVKVARVIGIAGARNDENVRTHGADVRHHLVDQPRRVNRNDDASRLGKPAGFEKLRIGGVAGVDVMALAPIARDRNASESATM